METAISRRGPARPSWVPEAEFPFESHFLEIEGHRVHYVDEGEGPVLLLVHGNPTWSFLYRHLIRELRTRFRCIAVDHPGFGLSTAAPGYDHKPASHARVLAELIRRLDLPEFTPMVQDWGGPIGLWAAAQHADRVRGLIIGNTWGWPITGDRHFERFSGMMGGPVGGFLIRHFNFFVNVMIPQNVKRKKLSADALRAYRGPFPTKDSRLPTWIFPHEIVHSAEFLAEVESGIERLRDKPALICWADRDIAFRLQERERFESIFSRHRTIELPGSGHYIQEDAPDEIGAAIRRWWEDEGLVG